MGIPLKEQLDNPHPQARKDCEGCWGSGWLTALVDNPSWLEDAGITKPADFCMSCSECEAMTDEEAIQAARKAGMKVDDSGLVHYTPEQLAYGKDAKYIYTLITPEGKEKVLGAFAKEGQARSFAKRKHPADWLSLCSYPILQRPLREGETVKWGDDWTN